MGVFHATTRENVWYFCTFHLKYISDHSPKSYHTIPPDYKWIRHQKCGCKWEKIQQPNCGVTLCIVDAADIFSYA